MAQPTPYTPVTNFAADEATSLAGRSNVRTANLDAEFSALNTTIDQTLANLLIIQRDDTELRDGVVKLHTLNSDVLQYMLYNGSVVRGAWVTATAYALKDLVTQGTATYICAVAHTSGTFATDLAAVKWLKIYDTQGVFTPTATITSTTVQNAIVEVEGDAAAALATRVAILAASTGAPTIGVAQTETGNSTRTVAAKLNDIKNRSDYSSLANWWAATPGKLRYNDTTGQVFGTTDSSPLDYSATRAGFVWQHRDTATIGTNALEPGVVFQFTVSGSGTVNAGTELSQSIHLGLFSSMTKTNDGSAHCFTGIGNLGAYGAGLYNELGGFQAELTNTGSVLGTISFCEGLIKDSADGGATHRSTKMTAFAGRIQKYNTTTRPSYMLLSSSEGTQSIDGIIGINSAGSQLYRRAIDLRGATFSLGETMLSPNNTFLSWMTSGAVAKAILGISAADNTILSAPKAGGAVLLTTNTLSTGLLVDDDASTNRVAIYVGGALQRIGVGAANSGGAGFRALIVPN